MDMAQLDRAQSMERTFARRAARTQRSKWLTRFLLSMTGMGLMLFVRLNPSVVEDVMAWSQGTSHTTAQPAFTKPADARATDKRVRVMPSNFVPVRRGGDLPGNGNHAPQGDAQAQADAVSKTLHGLSPSR